MSATSAAALSAVFKAYDVRGTVPDQIDEDLARAVGSAFVQVTDAVSTGVVVGHDMRPSSPGMARAFAEGAAAAGADVTMIGLASTDQLYFASGTLDLPGAMFTASHNPAQYNGIKMCRARAVPLGMDTGLSAVRDLVAAGEPLVAEHAGEIVERDLLADYAKHLLGLAPVRGRRLTVAVDAGNGMAGHTAPAVLEGLDLEIVPMYYELDGTFPNHEANPIEPANLADLQAKVLETGADIGLAFDGDADRCFIVDERGGDRQPVGAHRADRVPRAGPGARLRRDPQPDHLPRGPRAGHRARRDPGAHPRRALLHQGDDGRDRRGLRRRALGTLLLPRLLAGRLRHARGAARAGRAGRAGPTALRAAGGVLARTSRRGRSTRRSPTRPRSSRRSRRPTARSTASRWTTSTG